MTHVPSGQQLDFTTPVQEPPESIGTQRQDISPESVGTQRLDAGDITSESAGTQRLDPGDISPESVGTERLDTTPVPQRSVTSSARLPPAPKTRPHTLLPRRIMLEPGLDTPVPERIVSEALPSPPSSPPSSIEFNPIAAQPDFARLQTRTPARESVVEARFTHDGQTINPIVFMTPQGVGQIPLVRNMEIPRAAAVTIALEDVTVEQIRDAQAQGEAIMMTPGGGVRIPLPTKAQVLEARDQGTAVLLTENVPEPYESFGPGRGSPEKVGISGTTDVSDICEQLRQLLNRISGDQSNPNFTQPLKNLIYALLQNASAASQLQSELTTLAQSLVPGMTVPGQTLSQILAYVNEICEYEKNKRQGISDQFKARLDPEGTFAKQRPQFADIRERNEYDLWFQWMRDTEKHNLRSLRNDKNLEKEYREKTRQMRGLERGQKFSHIIPTPRKVINKEDREGQASDLHRLIKHYEYEIVTKDRNMEELNRTLQLEAQDTQQRAGLISQIQEQVNNQEAKVHSLRDSPEKLVQEQRILANLGESLRNTIREHENAKSQAESVRTTLVEMQMMNEKTNSLIQKSRENIADIEHNMLNDSPLKLTHSHIQQGMHDVHQEALHDTRETERYVLETPKPKKSYARKNIQQSLLRTQKALKRLDRKMRSTKAAMQNFINIPGSGHQEFSRLQSQLTQLQGVSGIDQNTMSDILETVKKILPKNTPFNARKFTPHSLRFGRGVNDDIRKIIQKLQTRRLGNPDISAILLAFRQPTGATDKFLVKFKRLYHVYNELKTDYTLKQREETNLKELQASENNPGSRLKKLQKRKLVPKPKPKRRERKPEKQVSVPSITEERFEGPGYMGEI